MATTQEIDRTIRRANLRVAWRLRWTLPVREWTRLEQACAEEWGAAWREAVEAA
jgi:hypothetical protein